MSIVNHCVSLGRFFAVIAPQGAGSPVIDRCGTKEHDGFRRYGSGFLIRMPFTGHRPTLGFVIGRWRKSNPRPRRFLQMTAPRA